MNKAQKRGIAGAAVSLAAAAIGTAVYVTARIKRRKRTLILRKISYFLLGVFSLSAVISAVKMVSLFVKRRRPGHVTRIFRNEDAEKSDAASDETV